MLCDSTTERVKADPKTLLIDQKFSLLTDDLSTDNVELHECVMFCKIRWLRTWGK